MGLGFVFVATIPKQISLFCTVNSLKHYNSRNTEVINCSLSNFWIIYVCDLNRKNKKRMIICSVTGHSQNQIVTLLWQKKKNTAAVRYVNSININFLPLFFTLHWTIQAKKMYKTALFSSRLTWWKFQQKIKAFVFIYTTISKQQLYWNNKKFTLQLWRLQQRIQAKKIL